MSFSVLNYIYI